jgi:HPP family
MHAMRGMLLLRPKPNFNSQVDCARGAIVNRTTKDVFWATLGEGGLVLAMAALSWVTKQPLIFASLGPTAYELVEQPQLRSARAYNIIVGHMVALGASFFALYVLSARNAAILMSPGEMSSGRQWAAVIAATLTTLITLMLKASQPAALATALLVSLGLMQTRRDALAIAAGVLIITAIGEPVRRFRLKYTELRPVVPKLSAP